MNKSVRMCAATVLSVVLVLWGVGGANAASDQKKVNAAQSQTKTQKQTPKKSQKKSSTTRSQSNKVRTPVASKKPIVPPRTQPSIAKLVPQTPPASAITSPPKVFSDQQSAPVLIPTIAPIKKEKPKDIELLNVSYDPTRELYEEFNAAFAAYWLKKTDQKVTIKQSRGGSGKQARSVIDGLEADVVTLALSYDIDAISKAGLIRPGWESQFKDSSAPYTSTIVLLVRKGNPKNILDWNDLIKPGVSVITPNPKTGGGAKWNFLAAWGYFLKKYKNNEEKAISSIAALYKNVAVLDSGARGSTTTFVERGIGDVYISWENEAHLIKKQYGSDYEIVTPSISILAQPSVAVVDNVAEKRGSKEVATAYLDYLFTTEGQTIAAKHFYRPLNADVLKKFKDQFDDVALTNISDFGGWDKVHEKFFKEGAIYDQIFSTK